MKKSFIAALTALALCSYSYAQYDEDEYEEEDSPAAQEEYEEEEEEEEEEVKPAPAKKTAKAKTSKKESTPRVPTDAGNGTLGLQMDLLDAFNGSETFYVTYKIASDMEASLIFGFKMHGETDIDGTGAGDDYTELSIGAAFDFFVTKQLLPISVGAEFIYSSLADGYDSSLGLAKEEMSQVEINILGGFRANLVSNLYLTAKVGLSIDINSWTENSIDCSSTDFGFKLGANLGWFFL